MTKKLFRFYTDFVQVVVCGLSLGYLVTSKTARRERERRCACETELRANNDPLAHVRTTAESALLPPSGGLDIRCG